MIIGVPGVLRRYNDSRVICIDDQNLGKLKGAVAKAINNRYGTANVIGYYVTGTFKYYGEEAKKYDEEHATNFYTRWDNYTKQQGFVLLPLVAGYGK